jgi:hypothetical protein
MIARMKRVFKSVSNRKRVRINEEKNEIHEIDYEYDRSREKISLKPKAELIKAIIEINEIKNILSYHKDSVKNVHFKEISMSSYIKHYDDIDEELKRTLITI